MDTIISRLFATKNVMLDSTKFGNEVTGLKRKTFPIQMQANSKLPFHRIAIFDIVYIIIAKLFSLSL